jgi:hypothetical protein
MRFAEALASAERHLTAGATLSELKDVRDDLRALARDSDLATLVDRRIARAEADQAKAEGDPDHSG